MATKSLLAALARAYEGRSGQMVAIESVGGTLEIDLRLVDTEDAAAT